VKEKYRFNFEKVGKCPTDDMLWVFDNFIIGISENGKHFKMNHYGLQFDKTNYIKVDIKYDLDDFYQEYFNWFYDDEAKGWYL
jgi:hypothetical protein